MKMKNTKNSDKKSYEIVSLFAIKVLWLQLARFEVKTKQLAA